MTITVEKAREDVFRFYADEEDINQQGHRFLPKYRNKETFQVEGDIYGHTVDSPDSFVTSMQGMFDCKLCGAYPNLSVDQANSEKLIFIAGEKPCEFPDGFTYEVTLNVLSDELVFSDFFNVPGEREALLKKDINSKVGQKLLAEWLQERNIGYTQLSDGGYEVYRNIASGDIYIGELYDQDVDDDVLPEGHELLGHISCDVFAVCMTDSETYVIETEPREEDYVLRVSVPAGEYTLTNYTTLADHQINTGKPTIHATLKKVSK